MKNKIATLCAKLRIGNIIADNYEDIQADTHEQFLLQLLTKACQERDINRKNRLLKQAGFDLIKTFDNYEFDEIQIPPRLNIDDLKEGEFVKRQENLILYGNIGTGKTHLATAIGYNLIKQGKNVKFYRTAALVNQLTDAKKEGCLGDLMKVISKADLLICDEWGYIPLEGTAAQLLFQVIADCYEKRSVIITTNIEFNAWNTIFYDEKITTAIIDRLIHHGHLLMFNGKSKRLKNSLINNWN